MTTAPAWLWVAFTVIAAFGQVLRNAAQKSLTEKLGTAGATHIRFLFGLPFGLLGVAAVAGAGATLPAPTLGWLGWTILGGVSQIFATAMMLTTMRERSFVVTTAYIKTEPVQIALFVVVFLGEAVSLPAAVAILMATAGVLIMSWPAQRAAESFSLRPALLGIAAGGLFGLAAVCFRAGILSLGSPEFIPAAIMTVALALAVQTTLLTGWLLLREPGVLAAMMRLWRPSLFAGFLGAFASQMWFLAFAIENPARVRTLALIEILIAGVVSRRYFQQIPSGRELIGMAVMVAGIVLLVQG